MLLTPSLLLHFADGRGGNNLLGCLPPSNFYDCQFFGVYIFISPVVLELTVHRVLSYSPLTHP